jgi:surface antigen
MAAIVLLGFSMPGLALADSFDDQINALRAQVTDQQNQASALHAQADSYQARVNELRAQMGALQTQISLNQVKYTKVSAQIDDAKVKMAEQKSVLARNIKTMYLDSGVTPIEMLASSGNLSDFFDQQQYQDKVKSKIQSALETINALKKSLEDQQAQLTQILADQKVQREQLTAQQNEVNQLLAVAAQNASAADAQVKNSNSQIASLKAQQQAALAAKYGNAGLTGGGSCGGGYPGRWCNAPQDSTIDNWGMYNRECVSYTAFKVAVSGRYMPYWGGAGNANQWPGNARAAGIPVDGNPRTGDVAISLAGPYGHAMYLEAVLPGGRIHVSQYNYGVPGTYSEMTIPAGGLYFIHF